MNWWRELISYCMEPKDWMPPYKYIQGKYFFDVDGTRKVSLDNFILVFFISLSHFFPLPFRQVTGYLMVFILGIFACYCCTVGSHSLSTIFGRTSTLFKNSWTALDRHREEMQRSLRENRLELTQTWIVWWEWKNKRRSPRTCHTLKDFYVNEKCPGIQRLVKAKIRNHAAKTRRVGQNNGAVLKKCVKQ